MKQQKLEREVKLLSCFACDDRFKPGLIYQNLRKWGRKGITAVCTITKNGKLMTFQEFRDNYGLENNDLFRYLQLRDNFIAEIKLSKSLNP